MHCSVSKKYRTKGTLLISPHLLNSIMCTHTIITINILVHLLLTYILIIYVLYLSVFTFIESEYPRGNRAQSPYAWPSFCHISAQ